MWDIKKHILAHRETSVSNATIKRVLKRAGLSRPPGRSRSGSDLGGQRLELGGMVLVSAASQETGYVKALAGGVASCLEQLEAPSDPPPPDTADRDAHGRFQPSYNSRLIKTPDDVIGPGFNSVENKRLLMVPERLHVSHARGHTIERKLTGLLMSPALQLHRWDDLRVDRGKLLRELCGFPYMPSTLDLFTRELKYVGVANTLWEAHARLWWEQTIDWEVPRYSAVLYIDGLVKPIHTKLQSECSKVSSLGRVMPSLEVVSFHTGSGAPLWMVTCSGRTPLVNAVPELLNRIPTITGDHEIGGITIIDAEGNSVPYMKTIESSSPSRAWLMRIKASMIDGKYVFNRSNYRSYRAGERIRMGLIDLNDPDVKGRTFRVRLIELERSNGRMTYLAASTRLALRDWNAAELADLYFRRWPSQEANFRSINQATAFKEVHGYGKQSVDNVTVITKQDELRQQLVRLTNRHEKNQERLAETTASLKEGEKNLKRLRRRQATVNRNLEGIAAGDRISSKQEALLEERNDLQARVESLSTQVSKTQGQANELEAKTQRDQAKIEAKQKEADGLESRKKVLQHDTELDSLFSLLKVGLTMLITYVLKVYLGEAKLEAETFLKRIASLPATRRLLPQIEMITFDYNVRDPEIMELLAASCARINQRMIRGSRAAGRESLGKEKRLISTC